MGTAVLLPQDCLKPRSRLKNQSPLMVYPVESAPRSKRNRSTSSQGLDAGLLPLPCNARPSSPMSVPRRGSDVKHIKARKSFGLNGTSPPSTATPDLSLCRILQRPKQEDSAIELLAHFAILGKSGLLVGEVNGSKVEAAEAVDRCVDITAGHNGVVSVEMDAFKTKKKCLHSRVGELPNVGSASRQGSPAPKGKGSVVKVSHSKMKEKRPSGFSAAKPIMAKTVGGNGIMVTRQHFEEQDKFSPKGLAQLRRTTTEPLPSMAKHIGDQYTSHVMQISSSNYNLEAYACSHQICGSNVDFSCEERWAGPAYSASPPPSLLPLPKLCLPPSKLTATVKIPPLVKQYSTGVCTSSFIETAASSCAAPEMGGAWDAAFATKSLRRLLNLDAG